MLSTIGKAPRTPPRMSRYSPMSRTRDSDQSNFDQNGYDQSDAFYQDDGFNQPEDFGVETKEDAQNQVKPEQKSTQHIGQASA